MDGILVRVINQQSWTVLRLALLIIVVGLMNDVVGLMKDVVKLAELSERP